MTHVHFVGSVALDTPEEVFAEIGRHCGPYLKRVPDGEPGARRLWINFQIPVLRGHASLVPAAEGLLVLFPLKLAEGVNPDDIHFGELGYARERTKHPERSAPVNIANDSTRLRTDSLVKGPCR